MQKRNKSISGRHPLRPIPSGGEKNAAKPNGSTSGKAGKAVATGGRAAKLIVEGIFRKQPGLKEGVRTVFVERSAAAIARIAANADERSLRDALTAATDVGTLAAVLSDADVVGEGVRELDPLAPLIARSVGHKIELIARAGGVLGVQQVAQLLGITRQAVDKRRREGKLLAVPKGSDFLYPVAQFADGEVAPGLREVLAAMGLEGPWGTLDFLTAADDELDGESPLGWLKRHPEQLEPVLRLARTQGEHGA